VANTV
jgi:hypothetical protein